VLLGDRVGSGQGCDRARNARDACSTAPGQGQTLDRLVEEPARRISPRQRSRPDALARRDYSGPHGLGRFAGTAAELGRA